MSVNRRNFLRGAAGTIAAATALGVSRPAEAADKGGSPDPATISVPFLGANQAGVYRPDFLQKSACFAAFRLLVEDSAGLQLLLQTLTSHIHALSEGSLPAQNPPRNPPRESEIGGLDSGVLGAQVPPDAVTVTVGLGAGVFTDRYGLTAARPRGLSTMPVFANDSPDPDWTGGDLVLQICSNASDSVHHALRDLTRATRGMMQLEWKILGFHSGPRPTGAPRNLFGYKDGIVNPTEDESLVWIDAHSGQPEWAVGGTFMVVRLIRMLVEFWDRVGVPEQNAIIGRDRDEGAPLGCTSETDLPDYAADPDGAVIPLDSHIRLANPRTADTDRNRILRRGYNYENHGMSRNGNSETGLIFCSYQQNLQDQFEVIQRRLADEPMTDYIQPYGGGYFVVPPGVEEFGGYLGQGLFA
jgi:deferrochelatase/peroxidase EfeB